MIGNITYEEFAELKKKYGLHGKAKISDLPAKVLAEKLTIDELKVMMFTQFFGNHFDAMKIKDKEAFARYDHMQWDFTLSMIGGTRICGLPNKKGECPAPMEEERYYQEFARKQKEEITNANR